MTKLDKIDAGILTLMIPEPTGGFYKSSGVEAFIRKFGYPDMTGQAGREDRLNFGGVHRVGYYHERTGLGIVLQGYNMQSGKIKDATGGIALMNENGEEAAIWHYADIMKHWNRKHAQAAYVPSLFRTPPPEYRYGPRILLCEQTDFSLFLKAVSDGVVYYDPGIKMEQASSPRPVIKRRSQFRVTHNQLAQLYHNH